MQEVEKSKKGCNYRWFESNSSHKALIINNIFWLLMFEAPRKCHGIFPVADRENGDFLTAFRTSGSKRRKKNV